MASKVFRFSGLVAGLYAAANIFDQPQGSLPRISNLVFTERGGLLTTDGTHVISRPAPPPAAKGFISSGAISSEQPPAPTIPNSSTQSSGGNTGNVPLSIDVDTPTADVGDLLIAIVFNQNKNFFSDSPPVTPPSPDWLTAVTTGGSNTNTRQSVFVLAVTGPLPSTLTFTTVPDFSVSQQAMMVVVIPVRGANNASPVDNINLSQLTENSGTLLINGTTTEFLNDLVLLAAVPTLNFFGWGGVVTPGIPAGTSQVALLQDAAIGQTMAVWTQSFVGPGFTGNYLSVGGWGAMTGDGNAAWAIAIGAGFPNDGDIEGFEPTDDSTITPDPVITGASTLLSSPLGIYFDSQKRLWIADSQSGNQGGIFMYKAPAQDTGNRAPDNVIQGSMAELLFPQDVVVDGSGKIYVANNGTPSQNGYVAIFPPGATGNVPPTTTIAGANTTLVHPVGVAVDAFGNIYVIDSTQDAVIIFPPNVGGNIFPSKVISGINTLIFNPLAIRFDSLGNLWVAVGKTVSNPAYLLVFAPGVGGNAIPLNLISSAALQPVSGNGGPTGLSFDTGGNIWVAVYKNQSALKFNVGAMGPSTPSATLTGWINGPWGIALPPV